MEYSSPVERLIQSVLTVEQIRSVDQTAISRFGMHSLVLMENAAIGCVQWIAQRFPQPIRTIVLCGSGNNGGDGLVIIRHLRARGWDCQGYILGPEEKFSSDTYFNAKILRVGGAQGLTIVEPSAERAIRQRLQGAELIIDAMLGTGATGNPRPPVAQWIEWSNASAAFRLAIDIPSGINANTGEVGNPHFHAGATLTFVARKPSMVDPAAHQLYGELTVLPIGIPEQQIVELLSLVEPNAQVDRG